MSRLITPDQPEPPEADAWMFGTPKERLDFYRNEIQFEMNQLASRTNAYLTAQSFIVIAYASAMANLNPKWGELYTLVMPVFLALLGIVSSMHAWPGIKASTEVVYHWQFKQAQLLRSDLKMGWAYDESPLFSEREYDRKAYEKTLLFSRRSPILFSAFWGLLVVFSLWLQLPMVHI